MVLENAPVGLAHGRVKGEQTGVPLLRVGYGKRRTVRTGKQCCVVLMEHACSDGRADTATVSFQRFGSLPDSGGDVLSGPVASEVRVRPSRLRRSRNRRGDISGYAGRPRGDPALSLARTAAVDTVLRLIQVLLDFPGDFRSFHLPDIAGGRLARETGIPPPFLPARNAVVVPVAIGMDLPAPQLSEFVRPLRGKPLRQKTPGGGAQPVPKLALFRRRLMVCARLGGDPVYRRNPLRDDEFGMRFRKLPQGARTGVIRSKAQLPTERLVIAAGHFAPTIGLDDQHAGVAPACIAGCCIWASARRSASPRARRSPGSSRILFIGRLAASGRIRALSSRLPVMAAWTILPTRSAAASTSRSPT